MNKFIVTDGYRAVFSTTGALGVVVFLETGEVSPERLLDSILTHTVGQWDPDAAPVEWNDSWRIPS